MRCACRLSDLTNAPLIRPKVAYTEVGKVNAYKLYLVIDSARSDLTLTTRGVSRFPFLLTAREGRLWAKHPFVQCSFISRWRLCSLIPTPPVECARSAANNAFVNVKTGETAGVLNRG